LKKSSTVPMGVKVCKPSEPGEPDELDTSSDDWAVVEVGEEIIDLVVVEGERDVVMECDRRKDGETRCCIEFQLRRCLSSPNPVPLGWPSRFEKKTEKERKNSELSGIKLLMYKYDSVNK
jgi:hypothetical protein